MTNKFISLVDGNRSGIAPNFTSRFSRFDSVSIVSRYRVLPILLLCLTLFIGVGNAWGNEVSINISTFGWNTTQGSQSASQGGITIASDNGAKNSTTQLRFYAGGTHTFTSTVGNITKVEFTCTASGTSNYGPGKMSLASGSAGSYSYNGTKGTWSGNAASFTLSGGQARCTSIVITYTASATSHTLSSAVNPANSGTVSLSTTSVAEGSTATATATPAAHYTFSNWSISGTGASLSSTTTNPTTVTMGTTNATVTANFTPTPKASITLSEAGASTTDETTYYVGDEYPLPESTEATCNGKVLVGWSTVTVAETNTKPTTNFYEKGAKITLGATQTFYAVFATATGTPESWDPVTSAPSDWSGEYVITNPDKTYAMTSDFYSGTSGEFKGASVTVTNNKVVSPTDKMIWTVAKNGNNAQYSFKNKSTGTYAKITGTNSTNAALDASAVWFTIESTGTSGVWDVASVTNSARCFSWYATNSSFRTYAKNNYNTGYLFKKSGGATYSAYSTTCCTPLGQINGSVSVTQTSAVVKLASEYSDASNADAYQLKVVGSSNYEDWTNVDKANLTTSIGVTVNGLSCGTNYTAYLRAKGSDTYCDYGTESHVDFTTSKYSISVADGITNGTIAANKATECPEETVTLTVTPSSAGNGYHLASWSLNGVAQDVNTLSFTMPASNVTITGTFEANNVPMAINVTATDKATVTASAASALAGANITLSCTNVADGYQFFGWTVTAGGNSVTVTNPTSATGASFEMPAAVTTVTADIRQMVTVTFKRDGSEYDSQTTYVGGTVTFPSNPSKFDNDYPNFIGWADAISGIATSAPTLKSESDAITEDVEYHAVFGSTPAATNDYKKITALGDLTEDNYLVVSYASTAYVMMASNVVSNYYVAGKVVTPDNDIITTTDAECIFAFDNDENGWSIYNDAETDGKYIGVIESGNHHNLKPEQEDPHYFTCSVNEGAWTITSTTYTSNSILYNYYQSTTPEFTVEGSFTNPIYLFKQQYSQEFVTRQVVSYTITYDKNTTDEVTGTIPTYPSAVSGSSHTISSAELSREGYNFVGWNTDKDATTAQTGSVTITGNTTFFAIWEAIPTYDIEFSVNGAKVAALKLDDILEGTAITFPDAAAITAASAFPATDKKFMGWIEASSYASDDAPTFVTSATATADKTYYAVFADVENGGYEKVTSAPDDWSGDYILAYDNSATEAYVFTGVDAASNYATAEVSSNTIEELPTGGVTITIASIPETTNYSIMVNGGTNNGKYLQGSASNGLSFQTSAQANQITWDNTNGLLFVNSSSYMRFNANTNNYRFRYYKSATYTQSGYNAISLYKLSASASDYVTNISPLSSIAITTAPTKTVYKKGQMLNLANMVVTATYENSRTRAVTNYTVNPSTTTALATTDVSFTVSYTEGEITRTDYQEIHVYELSGIAITTPTKTTYNAGETFDPAGMTVTATWGGSALDKIAETVDSYTYSPNTAFVNETDEDINVDVTISYTHEGVTKTATQVVTVHPLANLTMTWNVAGETSTSKIYVNAQDKYLLALPADPEVPEAFGSGYEFIGWTSDATIAKNGQGINWAAANDEMTVATEFKAVFAQANTPFFKETFDDCDGTGGNDDSWSGSIASNTTPESISSTWTLANDKAADACLKLGSGDKKGSAQTPSFSLTGSATLTFKAGAWNATNEGTTLNISATGATLKQNDEAISSATLTKGEWTTYTIDVTEATGTVTITFEAENASNNRFFLDEVEVKNGDAEYSNYRFMPSSVVVPAIALAEGTYYGAPYVTITQAQEKQIFYSLDGNTWTEYTAPVALDQAGAVTLSAKAYDEDQDDYSSVVSKSYTIVTEIDAPTMTASCVFVDDQTVTISHDMNGTEGFALQYSYDGENYTAYTEALTVTETTTIYAKATIGSLEATAQATYTKGQPVQYTKVTSADGLAVGMKFIIVGNSGETYKAAGARGTNSYLAAVDINAPSDNTITIIEEAVNVFELKSGATDWLIYSEEGYLVPNGNNITTKATLSNNDEEWEFFGTKTIVRTGTNDNKYFEYNTSSPRFKTYQSQADIDIYAIPFTAYTLTLKDYDDTDLKSVKVVAGGQYKITEEPTDVPTSTPGATYEFVNKWTDGTNMYAVGDIVTISANTTLLPCWKVTPTDDVIDIDGLPESVTEIVVSDGKDLNVNDDRTINTLTIKSTSGAFGVDGTSGQVIGGSTLTVTDNLFLEIKLCDGAMNEEASGRWYCISAPFDVAINGGFFWGDGTPMVLNTHFQLFEWDGDRRATGASGWRRTNSNMKAGIAYFIGFDDERVEGCSTCDVLNQNTIKLKAMSNTISNTNKIVAPTHGTSGDLANWNGLGNPNFHHIALDQNVQAFDYNEQHYNPYATGLYNFVVGTPFFIQYAGDIAVSAANGSNPYRAPKREGEDYSYCVRIGNAEASRADNQIYVRASETASAEFDSERDMITLNSTTSKYGALLWTENYGGKRLAIEEAPLVNGTALYVLTLSAPKDGTYSISVASPKENAELFLTKDGAIIWNLSMGEYTIDLNKGTTNGYGLLLNAKAPMSPTGIENTDALNGANGVQKIVLDEKVFILRGGKMYGIDGKAVK